MDIIERVKQYGVSEIEKYPHDILLHILDNAEEIERLRIHYDGAIMYGNRLVDAIHWAQSHGIVFPNEIYNACINPIQHFRMERERLKEIE